MKNLFIGTKETSGKLKWLKYIPARAVKDIRISRKDMLKNLEYIRYGDVIRLKEWDVIMSCRKDSEEDRTWQACVWVYKNEELHALKRTKLVTLYMNDVATDDDKNLLHNIIKAEISDCIAVGKALAIWTEEQREAWWTLIVNNNIIDYKVEMHEEYITPPCTLSDATMSDIKAQIDNLVDVASGTV